MASSDDDTIKEARVPGGAGELRLADLETFLSIAQFGSISAAARSLRVTPSQVSKAVARLEVHLGASLLGRTPHGVGLSKRGQELLPRFVGILERIRGLYGTESEGRRALTIASTAFLNATFVPPIASALPELRIRSVELPPRSASAHAGAGFFDLALTQAQERWSDSWVAIPVGELRRALFARPSLAKKLGPGAVSVEEVRSASFISPIYAQNGLTLPGDDGCPIPYRERRIGHETQTLMLALELAQQVDQVIFAPALSARPFLERRSLVEVPVIGWDVRVPLYLACHSERVQARTQRTIVELIGKVLAKQ